MNLLAQVGDCLRRHGLQHTTGIVAVSGGPDSVALAHLLAKHLDSGTIDRLVFAHLNHLLRGDESDEDERFVRELPALFQDPRLIVRSERIDVAALAHAEHANLESVARRERYRWLAQVAHAEKASWIATGHSADDQAETVLFRLLRGSGVLGLAGMAECRALDEGIVLVRPLLPIRRRALLDHLEERKLSYRSDSSNRELHFARNRLRLELLPMLMEQYNPAVVEVLCRLADQARELHEDVAEQARRILAEAELPRAGETLVFSVERLRDRSANAIRETFRAIWQREGWPMGDMDFERWQRLVEIVQGARPACDFPGGIHARCAGHVIQIHARES